MSELENKIQNINEKINNDDTYFISKIYEYYKQEYSITVPEKVFKTIVYEEDTLYIVFSKELKNIFNIEDIEKVNIVKVNKEDEFNENEIIDKLIQYTKVRIIINLNDISTYPIWDTYMRRKITSILKEIENIDTQNLTEKIIRKIIKMPKTSEIIENKKYSLDFLIKVIKGIHLGLKENIDDISMIQVQYITNNLTNEEIFFVNEFEKFLHALKLEENKLDYIYDEVCKYIDDTVLKYNYCNFKDNMCVSQRHKNLFNKYPVPKTDGCCFKVINKCEHNNKDGTCKVKCISCKLFTCPYLTKRGIGYSANEILLLRAFLDAKARRELVYNFYKPKEYILKKAKKRITKSKK